MDYMLAETSEWNYRNRNKSLAPFKTETHLVTSHTDRNATSHAPCGQKRP